MTERTFHTGDDDTKIEHLDGELSGDTILEQMRAEAAAIVDVEAISLIVPERPHFELLFMPNIDYDLLNSMMKKARKSIGGGKKEWNPLTFAYQIMSHTSTGTAYKGQV